MAEISATYGSQMAQIENLSQYVTDYCKQHNIDPATYVAALDGKDMAQLRDDPAFQAYWQLAAMQLSYLLSGGEQLYSEPGAVEFDDMAISASYNSADEQTREFIDKLLQDDPELMAFFAMQQGGNEEANNILAAINLSQNRTTTPPQTSISDLPEEMAGYRHVAEDARDFVRKYELGSFYDDVISTEEGIRSAEGSILNQIAEMDQQLADLSEAFDTGKIGVDKYNAEIKNVSVYRETLLAMMQNLESTLSTVMEMYSKMIEQQKEMAQSVIQNMRGA